MDAMQYEDPDARPKRLIVLAGAGMVVATGFATVAAMALPAAQRNTATPDIMVDPHVVSRSGTSSVPASTGRFVPVPPVSERDRAITWFSSTTRGFTDGGDRGTSHTKQASTAPGPGNPQSPDGDRGGHEPTGDIDLPENPGPPNGPEPTDTGTSEPPEPTDTGTPEPPEPTSTGTSEPPEPTDTGTPEPPDSGTSSEETKKTKVTSAQ